MKKLQYTTNDPSATTDYLAADNTWKTIPGGGGGSGIPKGTTSGTDTYTTTISGVTAYNDGDAFLIRFTTGNTTQCTLNINSLGAIPLYRNNDGELIGGDIVDGAEMLCVYNSTTNRFQVIGTAPNTLLSYVTNAESTTITKGQAVYAFGGTGDRLTVKLANNLTDATSAQTIGVVLSTSIAANQKGLIIMQGQIDGLSLFPTSTWADGDAVYLGATAGSFSKTKPLAPNHLVYLGFVTTASNGSAGRMYVRVQNGYEMHELHNVSAVSPANNDILKYNTSTSLWEKSNVLSTKQDNITLTTTGTSGAATLVGSTLNIPQYAGSGTGASILQVTFGGAVLSASQITFANFSNLAGSAGESARRLPMPTACTLNNFYFLMTTNQPASGSLVLTIRKNGADTALVITVAAGSVAGNYSNTTNSATFAAGDLMAIRFNNNATANSGGLGAWSCVMTI
jgi:hypothetical protein